MNAASWVTFALIVVPCLASAQGVNCPVRNAPMPMAPPGKPPEYVPKVTFPTTFEGEPKGETGVILPVGEDLVDAEEGDVTAIARSAENARLVPPPADVLRELVDTRKTLLSEWRFEGYLPEMPRHKVPRVFSRNGSVLIFEQWNMAADGASVVATPPQTVKIGRFFWEHGRFENAVRMRGRRSHLAYRRSQLLAKNRGAGVSSTAAGFARCCGTFN